VIALYTDKLTRLAKRRAYSRIATGVIVQTKPGRLHPVVDEIKPLIGEFFEFPRLFSWEIISMGTYPLKKFPRFNMFSAFLPREVIFKLAEHRDVVRIYSDEQIWALQYPTVPPEGVFKAPHKVVEEITFTSTWWTKRLIGADIANGKGFLGRGILVSVVDSGASRVHQQIRRVQFETTMKQYRDENGHGTWCTSCIGGITAIDDYLSQRAGKRIICEGMAPECGLLAIKSLGWVIGTGMTSNIIDAIELSIDRGADVISMSLGGPSETETPEDDPFYPVFQEVLKYNIIPVVAAGNEGPSENTISSPGSMPNVLTVGAYNPLTGEVANFSSRGPTNWGDIKPDCIAPGVNIDSAIVGVLDTAGDGTPSRYSPISGTSMATPHVSGLVALMREAMIRTLGRILTLDEIKEMLRQLGHEKTNEDGWGLIHWRMFEEWLSTQYGVEL